VVEVVVKQITQVLNQVVMVVVEKVLGMIQVALIIML
jgi:hypothetical protein|tara:strand:- start:186 stop:296 length:111 start_codon:yes stop_codon:yes gene_type:complete